MSGHAMTLTFDPLTLNMYGIWRVMWSIYVPNFNKIGPPPAELLTIDDRFFVRFRGCSNTARGDFKNAWIDLHQTWWEHVRSSLHTEFKNGEDILLGFQTIAAQS